MADFIEQIEHEEGHQDSHFDENLGKISFMALPRRVLKFEAVLDKDIGKDYAGNQDITSKNVEKHQGTKRTEPELNGEEKCAGKSTSLTSTGEIQWENCATDDSHIIWPVPMDVYSIQDLRDTVTESYRVSGESTELIHLLDSVETDFDQSWKNTYDSTSVSPSSTTVPQSQSSTCTENSQLSSEFDMVDLTYVPTTYVTPNCTVPTSSVQQHGNIPDTRVSANISAVIKVECQQTGESPQQQEECDKSEKQRQQEERLMKMMKRKEKNKICSRQFRMKQKQKRENLIQGKMEKEKVLKCLEADIGEKKGLLASIIQNCQTYHCPKAVSLLLQVLPDLDKENQPIQMASNIADASCQVQETTSQTEFTCFLNQPVGQ